MIAIEADSAAEATTHAVSQTARSTATQPRNYLVARLSGVFNYEMAISHSHGWETGQNGRMMMRGPETERILTRGGRPLTERIKDIKGVAVNSQEAWFSDWGC